MNTTQITLNERLSYYGFSFGQIMSFTVMLGFLPIFMTDIGISAAAVGVILLAARVWDAVNDPIFGVIVNRSNLKGGKYKPWLKLSVALISVFSVLLFLVPAGLPAAAKTAMAALLYIGWGMSYTMCDIPYFSITTMMTDNITERDGMIARGRLFTMLGAAVITIVMPILYPRIGWPAAGAIIFAIAFAAMSFLGRTAKERYRPVEDAPSLGDLVKTVTRNRQLLLFCLAVLISGITNTVSTVGGYFAIHCLGGPEMIPIISTVPLLVSVVFVAFVPAIIKQVDKFKVYLTAYGTALAVSILIYLTGYQNLVVFVALLCLRTAATMFTGTFIVLFIVDCAEYARYQSGEDTTAVSISLQTFTSKAITATSAALGMLLLGLAGFVGGAGAEQPPEVWRTLWLLMSIVPAGGFLTGAILLSCGYKLRDRYVQIMAKANKGDMTRDEAETLLPKSFAARV